MEKEGDCNERGRDRCVASQTSNGGERRKKSMRERGDEMYF